MKKQRGYTLFDLLGLFFILFCGMAAQRVLQPDGFTAAIFSFFLGCLVPILLQKIAARVYHLIRFPICKKQRCRGRHYQLRLDKAENMAKSGSRYRCQCGDEYIRTNKNEFKILNDDGSTEPYRFRSGILTPWRPVK
jgi:hypothetical protein